MDDNWRQVGIAIVGAVSAAAIAWLGFRHARNIESDRAKREDNRRWLADRRQAYSRLTRAFDLHHSRIVDRLDDPNADVVDEPVGGRLGSADEAYEDVMNIGGKPVRDAASNLYGQLLAMDVITRRPMTPSEQELGEQCRDELTGLWLNLRRAIHQDLGVEPDTDEEIAALMADDAPTPRLD